MTNIKKQAIKEAIDHVSALLAKKSTIAETPEQLAIMDHKIDVILAFENYMNNMVDSELLDK